VFIHAQFVTLQQIVSLASMDFIYQELLLVSLVMLDAKHATKQENV
jgi:hypothetical protein